MRAGQTTRFPSGLRALTLAFSVLGATGCLGPRGTGDASSTPAPWGTPDYGWPPPGTPASGSNAPLRGRAAATEARSDDRNASAARHAKSPAPFEPTAKTPEALHVPSAEGEACMDRLRSVGITFVPLNERKGVATPVRIRGPIAGIEFFAEGRELELDCRLALSLHQIAPVLHRHGVDRVRFSGAYVYRQSRHGRLSYHANGLAIDVHDIWVRGTKLEVKKDFARNAGCSSPIPLLNQIACELRHASLFQEFLTPDYDQDHRDHLHLAIPR